MEENRGPESSQRRIAPALGLSNSGKQMEEGSKKQYVKQVTGRHNDTELHLLVKNENLEGVQALLNACEDPGSLVSEENELGETPLHIAADRGNLEVLKELLRFAHPDAFIKKNRTGYDAFHIAARQ